MKKILYSAYLNLGNMKIGLLLCVVFMLSHCLTATAEYQSKTTAKPKSEPGPTIKSIFTTQTTANVDELTELTELDELDELDEPGIHDLPGRTTYKPETTQPFNNIPKEVKDPYTTSPVETTEALPEPGPETTEYEGEYEPENTQRFREPIWASMKEVCPQGFQELGPLCFLLNEQPRTWFEAVDYCRSLYADLLTIENETKMKLVTLFLLFEYKNLRYDNAVAYTEGHFWLGGFNRRVRDPSKNTWRWAGKYERDESGRIASNRGRSKIIDSDQAITYFPAEKNKYIVKDVAGAPSEDCLLIRHDGVWFNYYCFETLGTFCETTPIKV